MNVEAYNLDSLRKLVRDLQKENKELREILDQADIPYAKSEVFSEKPVSSEEYDFDQGGRINQQYIDRNMATKFFAMFWGREDVFAKRAKNGNYYPQCNNRWNTVCPKQKGEKQYCEDCAYRSWTKLKPENLINHLIGYREDGADVIGVYPLLPDGTCRFLVFDFDNHEKDSEKNDFANEDETWRDEVDALRLICKQNGIDALVERSRSGRGAHVWILFRKPVSAATARNFGFLLLDKGAATINIKSFRYYDRMYPSQDVANSIGNLVALPLQGRALINGNSAFVDENWNAYPDQWAKLFHTKKISQEEIEQFIAKWQGELFFRNGRQNYKQNRLKPWKHHEDFYASDVTGTFHIVLADGIYIDALNLKPRLQNQIRCMAAFDNPIFYKNRRLGYSNYYNFSTVYLGMDIDGYIKIPRGLLENVIAECKKSKIPYDITDDREKGHPLRISFKGELRVQQDLAAQRLLTFNNGILSAATAFGKTVVCSYLIAERKVNTLILLESTDLIPQWEDELNRFLVIDEEPPEYKTKTGRIKKRTSVIGILKGGKDTMTDTVQDKQDVNAVYDSGNYMSTFEQDLIEAEKEIVIASPQIIQEKIKRFIYLMKPRQEDGIKITVITENPENISYGSTVFSYELIRQMEEAGIRVKFVEEQVEHFAVIDQILVWHGGMNLLGKEDVWDNLIRVKDTKAASELLELVF